MITVKTNQVFDDIITGAKHQVGEVLELDDVERVRNMLKRNICSLVRIKPEVEKIGRKVIVYQNLLYCIGGIETADYQMARAFNDRDICFVFRTADVDQALRLGKYCEVVIDDGKMGFDCDVLILANYDSYPLIKGRVRVKKIYQQCHADWLNMKKMPQWANFDWKPDEDVDRVVAVSETTSKALKMAFAEPIESVVIPNILNEPDDSEFRVLLTLSRFSAEKGADLIIRMVDEFHRANKSFLWIICATMADSRIDIRLRNDKSVVFLPPSPVNEALIRNCDILVQLSKNESYCYSVHQALACGKPCLCTDIPEFRKVIRNGENGWLVGQHLENLDIDSIFSKRLNPKPMREEISPLWEELLNGEL